MSDITTTWNTPQSRGDWTVSGGDLATGHDVESAVLISLFTDRLADASDDVPDAPASGIADRRGWWGDGDVLIGSRLWLLDRVKGPRNVAQRAEDYAREAVQWLLDDAVVARFDISAEWQGPNRLNLLVTAYRSDGSRLASQNIPLW